MWNKTASEAIQNDAGLIRLSQILNDLYKYSTPKYVMQTNGDINAVNSKEFDEVVAKIVELIELRQQQIMSNYYCYDNYLSIRAQCDERLLVQGVL